MAKDQARVPSLQDAPDFHVFGFEYFDILDCLTLLSLSAMLED